MSRANLKHEYKMPRFERYYLLILVYIPLLLTFWLLERYVEPRYMIYSIIDSYIPYIPEFVVFYFVWFLYMFFATALFMFCSKRDFIRLTTFMAVGMTACYVIYIVFPNGQALRPQDTGSGVFGAIVAWLYTIDTPTNVCPSIHVLNSLAVHFSVCKSSLFKDNRLAKALSLIIATLINLSTVFIKQHSVIDVACGIVFALIIDYSIEKIMNYGLFRGRTV